MHFLDESQCTRSEQTNRVDESAATELRQSDRDYSLDLRLLAICSAIDLTGYGTSSPAFLRRFFLNPGRMQQQMKMQKGSCFRFAKCWTVAMQRIPTWTYPRATCMVFYGQPSSHVHSNRRSTAPQRMTVSRRCSVQVSAQKVVRIGTRGSPLALAQAYLTRDLLKVRNDSAVYPTAPKLRHDIAPKPSLHTQKVLGKQCTLSVLLKALINYAVAKDACSHGVAKC